MQAARNMFFSIPIITNAVGGDKGKGKAKTVASDKGNGKVVATDKGKGKVVAGDKGKGKAIASDKGKGKAVAGDKGKGKAMASDKRKGKAVATDKGKGKAVDGDNLVKPFVDSDYDLSDKEEDDIMTAQVEGWKRIVDVMLTNNVNDHIGDTSGSKDLPSDSPSSRTKSKGERYIDDTRVTGRRYKVATDLNDPRWEVGLRFNSKEDFTEFVRHQGVKLGKKLRLKKNDKIRCVAYCRGVMRSKKKSTCPWSVTLAYRAAHGFWQISCLRDTHKCGGASYNHGCANAMYLIRKYKEYVRVFPGMMIGQFIERVHQDMEITISSGKAKRAMQHACDLIEGDLIKNTRVCMTTRQKY